MRLKLFLLFLTFLSLNNAFGVSALEMDNVPIRKRGQITPGAWQTEKYFHLLKDRNIALVGNHSSLIGNVHIADSLLSAGFRLSRVFSPEHGFRGQAPAGEHVPNSIDSLTGLPVLSLYGANRRPNPADLHDIDLIIFDIQDVGARFYTYISTMTYVMEEAARQNIPLMILDRPNPNGHFVDGPILDSNYSSFVGMHPVPVVHGMTVAEYALMVNGEGWLEGGIKCSLIIVPVANYSREMWFEVPNAPSPNLPNMTSIMLYPSLCFFEGTVISLGRGTDFPFQVFGHPKLPEQQFPFAFTPESKPAAPNPPQIGNVCNGIDLRIRNPRRLMRGDQLDLGHLLKAYKYFPDKSIFFNGFFDRLAGTSQLRMDIISGMTEREIRKTWRDGLENFREMRRQYLIYPDI